MRAPEPSRREGLRIAVVSTFPPGKGSLNEYAYHFVRYLRRKPEVAEVIVLADDLPAGQRYEQSPGDNTEAPLRVSPCWRFDDWRNAPRVLAAVRRAKPDAVLFNIQFASFGGAKIPATLGLLAPALVKRAGFPTIVLLHNIMETVDVRGAGYAGNRLVELAVRTAGRVVTRLLLTADWVALTIPKYVELLERAYGTDNVLLAPHGAFDDSALPSFDLPPGPIQIMTFGKFGTYKKIESLVEAFALLQNGSRPPLELVIAGTDSPNAEGYLEGVRRRYADVPGIRFTGYVAEEDVPRVFGDSAVVVFPYTSTTGSSGVLHQAGEYGKAVVLPRIGDFAELIGEEGFTGEFFVPADGAAGAESLADAIARVIDDPERRRAIGTQNYLAAHGLPIADVVDWYLLHFQELLTPAPQRRARPQRQGAS